MPTLNELVNGFADKQTYERIQGVVHTALEDIHNHAVRIQALQSKPGVEGLIALAFPKLTKLMEEYYATDRKKATVESSNPTPPLQNTSNLPTPTKGVSRHPYSKIGSSGLSAKDADFTTADLHRYTNWNV
jgi:hypothetical protein